VESLTWSTRCSSPKSFQIFPIVDHDRPVRSAIFERVPCVAFGGVDPSVAVRAHDEMFVLLIDIGRGRIYTYLRGRPCVRVSKTEVSVWP